MSEGAEVRYAASQVVCVECAHIREMRGETDEVIRRTRSEEAENAVLNAVRSGGVEPDWFVERWMEGEGRLVACAVFEDETRCASFRAAVNDWVNKLERRNGGSPIRIRTDSALEAAVAEHFSEEWVRQRNAQMERYAKVLEDARESGSWNGRVLVGEYEARDEDAKRAFAELCEALKEACPNDENGEGGIAYSGFWDRGNVARFAFGFPDAEGTMAAQDKMDGIGARFYDPLTEGGVGGVELEMAALVIAKMQGEENARKMREEMERNVEAAGEAMEKGVKEGIAAAAERAME